MMSRKSIKGIYSKPMDAFATQPVIENRKLPTMDNASSQNAQWPKLATPNQILMDDARDQPTTGRKGNQMAAFKAADEPSTNPVYADQVPKVTRKPANAGYIVLRMRVQNGVLSVVGSKRVDSQLVNNDSIVQGGLTYEAILENTRLTIGSVPDYGEQRSFPRPGEHEHHITVMPSFDFNLKMPSDKITMQDLPQLKVSLYRFKEHVPDLKLGVQPLNAQFDKEVRVVAELNGIELSQLKPDVRELVEKAFKKP
ncbi:hypothetical protein [Spirosoma flavum]|uniref:Uncharacterized protein n=1 Tax=Spirosoma flavum TaxID=2048557 RepID=A0ABW6AC05_9BACT